MSYIRCLSNPEGLYIWGDHDGKVTISVGNEHSRRMPASVFHGVLKKWYASRDDVQYRGASIKENVSLRYNLEYQGWSIELWETTLVYICTQNSLGK